MSILDKIKLTKMREVSKLNKNQLEYDRKNFVKSNDLTRVVHIHTCMYNLSSLKIITKNIYTLKEFRPLRRIAI